MIGFAFTECQLAYEDISDSAPSPASGVMPEELTNAIDHDDVPKIVWLLEPRRSTVVKKWSGTLAEIANPRSLDQRTINAFAHFSYVYSREHLVFVDIQGEWLVIVDPILMASLIVGLCRICPSSNAP